MLGEFLKQSANNKLEDILLTEDIHLVETQDDILNRMLISITVYTHRKIIDRLQHDNLGERCSSWCDGSSD